MNHPEKEFENKLINALRANGFVAHHIDCGVDGFPDLIVAKYGSLFLYEIKVAEKNHLLSKVFKSSQPVMYRELQKVGVFVRCVVAGHHGITVHSTYNMLDRVLRGEATRVSDLVTLASAKTIDSLVFCIDQSMKYEIDNGGATYGS